MEKDEIRFKCLELSCRTTSGLDEVLARAERYAEFVASKPEAIEMGQPKIVPVTRNGNSKPSK